MHWQSRTELLRAKEEARKIRDTANNESEVVLNKTRLKTKETLYSLENEAQVLVEVRQSLNLTTEGVLEYLLNRLLADADNLKVTDSEPAKMSQRDELRCVKLELMYLKPVNSLCKEFDIYILSDYR